MIANRKHYQQESGKNYISAQLLESLMDDRDRSINRIEIATETKRKLMQARTLDEYKAISIPEELNFFGVYERQVMDSYISGFTLLSEEGTPRCQYGNMGALASSISPDLYRGEIRDYGLSSGFSTLGRALYSRNMNHESRLFAFFVEQIRKVIFTGFLTSFRQFREFPFGETLDGLIAQHYGLTTQFIDLTDDIKVALFFACCKHEGNNRYRPIRECDIEEMGKEGVIYHGHSNNARIIGFQPFCRCHRQRGYYIDTAAAEPCWDFSLAKNTAFEKYYFERTVALSERLFAEFEGGKILFPDDGLEPFGEAIDQIREAQTFPAAAFDIAYKVLCAYLEVYQANGRIGDALTIKMRNKDYLSDRLVREGYEICNKLKLKASQALIDKMNINWDPETFAQKEGFIYTPFIVMDK